MKTRAIEEDIDRIRQEIHEETQHMTNKELAEHFNKRGDVLAKKYGFKIADTTESALLRKA